jgi:hypothetical protein
MDTKRSLLRTFYVSVSVLLALMLAGGVTAASVEPIFFEHDPGPDAVLTCEDVEPDGEEWIEFKVDANPPVGTTPYNDGVLFLTITRPSTEAGASANSFDWSSSTEAVDAVIVKSGQSGTNLYLYDPERQSDLNLESPGGDQNISHITFCYDVGDDPTPPGEDPTHLNVVKFYDANANGINDDGIEITGWKVNVSPTPGDLFTPVSIDVAPGNYIVSEYTPAEENWVHTTDTSVPVVIDPFETETVEFGNLCLGAGGGHTLGFWSNKNGKKQMEDDGSAEPELQLLTDLNLVNADGSPFVASSYTDFRNWLLGASATNMAYMLSAQLAAMALNVEATFVEGDALIFAPGTESANDLGFATVDAVMAEANAALGADADGVTLSGDPNRAIQEALKDALDNANNNETFVQETPCTFTFADTTQLSADTTEKKKKKHRGRHGRGRRR